MNLKRIRMNVLIFQFFIWTFLFNLLWVGHFVLAKVDSEASKPSISELSDWFWCGFELYPKAGTLYSSPTDSAGKPAMIRASMNRITPLFPLAVASFSSIVFFVITLLKPLRPERSSNILQRLPLGVSVLIGLSLIAGVTQVLGLSIEGYTYGMIPLAFQMILAAIFGSNIIVNDWAYFRATLTKLKAVSKSVPALEFRKTIESALKLVDRLGIAALVSLVIGFTQVLGKSPEIVVSNRVMLYLYFVLAFGLLISIVLVLRLLILPLLALFEDADTLYTNSLMVEAK